MNRRTLKRLWLFGLAVAAAAFIAVPAGVAGSNSANAKACQKNGWYQLGTTPFVRFTSEEACTSYAAQGGRLFGYDPGNGTGGL